MRESHEQLSSKTGSELRITFFVFSPQAAAIYLRFFLNRVWASGWMDPADQAEIGTNLIPAALAVDNEPVNRWVQVLSRSDDRIYI